MRTTRRLALAAWLLVPMGLVMAVSAQVPDPFAAALANGRLSQEGFSRCHRYLDAWLARAEPTTGLIPRNLTDSPYWNGKDSAADNYPFMVLSAWFTDRGAYDGPLRRMLDAERRLTARPGWLHLTDDYNLEGKPGLRDAQPNAERIIFNSAEYVKDGLLALTEWLGPSPWSERMFELLDDSFALAAVDTPAGKVPMVGINRETGVEVSGDYLQALSRTYWLSGGQEKYLEWGGAAGRPLPAARVSQHTRRATSRCSDCATTAAKSSAACASSTSRCTTPERRPAGTSGPQRRQRTPRTCTRCSTAILAVGRNADGLLYNSVDPQTGKIVDARLSDSWGYVFDAYYAVWMVDGTEAYREAAFKPLAALWEKYRGFDVGAERQRARETPRAARTATPTRSRAR